ncbi:ABC transporter ATP-binding protein [Pseudoalteromonas rubra]|uniref:ABC transporter ATP-binding protein n=1 Tax=Pseudoalteromonas rubra TaxID=43658 RepID=A0A4Q7ECV3_9GAMM|nr:ABC transporter ATP-binding protein [Pseudoalteromonas rubra]RZM81241.1 ABC transporter ATP-binding protein [Pseudoalteromonas rubra]
MLTITNLSKYYGAHCALRQVSFSVEPGTVLTILGPNGAGKTTLFKILAGLSHDYQGSVCFGPDKKLQAHDIGFVFDSSRAFYPKLTAFENLRYFGVLKGLSRRVAKDTAQQLLHKFNLSDKAEQQVQLLSRGMQQRLALCLSLISSPKVLLLDEPTLGLDIESQKEFELCIEQVKETGTIVLIATHQMDTAQRLGNYSLLLNKGEVVRFGNTQTLLANTCAEQYTITTQHPLPEVLPMQCERLSEQSLRFDTAVGSLNEMLTLLTRFNIVTVEKHQASLEGLIRRELDLS